MKDKTIGQIAFEASQQWHGYARPWSECSLSEQGHWEHVANAVYEAVIQVFGGGDVISAQL